MVMTPSRWQVFPTIVDVHFGESIQTRDCWHMASSSTPHTDENTDSVCSMGGQACLDSFKPGGTSLSYTRVPAMFYSTTRVEALESGA